MAKGKRPGDTPPVQKGTGSITKKKPETKAADAAAAKPRKPKSKSNTAEDDEALIASLISCASGSEKKEKKEGLQQDLDMELVAALAAEACLPARHAGCDSRCVRFFGSSLFWFVESICNIIDTPCMCIEIRVEERLHGQDLFAGSVSFLLLIVWSCDFWMQRDWGRAFASKLFG